MHHLLTWSKPTLDNLASDAGQGSVIAGAENEVRALNGETSGDRRAESAAAAGDDDDLPLQAHLGTGLARGRPTRI